MPLRVVIDASVGLKWVLPEEDSDQARALLADGRGAGAQFLAPDAYLPEVVNALWARSSLRDEITGDEARDALERLFLSIPTLVPSTSLATQALELALAFRRPVYDCLYVALAIRLGCVVVTADRRMIRTFGEATGRVTHIADFNAGR